MTIHQEPPSLISTDTAEHYTWGANCDGWFLLKSESHHVIQERMPPGTAEQMHWHRNSRQLFYVLKGELTMRRESVSTIIPAGHCVIIDPLSAHQARNDSKEDVEFLVISVPPSHGDRFTHDDV